MKTVYEIHPVVEYRRDDGEGFCEPWLGSKESFEALKTGERETDCEDIVSHKFWTLYKHTEGVGVTALIDCMTETECETIQAMLEALEAFAPLGAPHLLPALALRVREALNAADQKELADQMDKALIGAYKAIAKAQGKAV